MIEHPHVSDGLVSAEGPSIRLLRYPTCEATRVVDLCAVDAGGRLCGHCVTCEELVPSNGLEVSL